MQKKTVKNCCQILSYGKLLMLLNNQYCVYVLEIHKKENKWNMTSIIRKNHLGYIKILPFNLRCSFLEYFHFYS